MSFIHDNFLLHTDTARRLYHDFAAAMPIYDYHCHLSPADLAANRRFNNLFELWLEGDHYKWRAMRSNGVDERYCTGDADPYDKFLAWAGTVPHTIRNPLYHWTHLELKRYFGIDDTLNEHTAPGIWDEANRQIADMPASAILSKFNVALIDTTDDPADSLEHHCAMADDSPYADTVVYPSFRPDKAHNLLSDVKAWNKYVDNLAHVAGIKCDKLDGLVDALRARHAFFHVAGCRVSDHGLTHVPATHCAERDAKRIFKEARDGKKIGQKDRDKLTVYLMLLFGEMNHAADWTMQLHLGPIRNNNAWAFEHLGPDTGFDSIGDYPQAQGLSTFMGELAGREKLPRTILYNINPADNYVLATMVANFQGVTPGSAAGKIQYGSGWWFLDQKEAMTWQINALSNLGLLTRFVGMLTDSRSFLSYPRHEYFRRVLCDLLGRDVEAGELPGDVNALGEVVKNICFTNARNYFGMTLKGKHA